MKTRLILVIVALLMTTSVFAQQERQRTPRQQRPPRDREQRQGGQNRYSIEQAISDNAQLHTIAFNGLAFLTGDFGAATFIPPGKVCDFFGFQYMRDIDVAQTGHNPMFLNRVAANVLYTLNDQQRGAFERMARKQAIQLRQLAIMRMPLIKAFYRQANNEIPAGSQGLNENAVAEYVGKIFAFDAALSYDRAKMYGDLVKSLTADQKAYLAKMKFGDFGSWPDVDMEPYKLPRGTEKLVNVAYMTYASEFFSWYAGSVEADTYFCPERHGTYFGGFYMKDMPAMGKRDYNISTSLTGDSGAAFLDLLTAEQREKVTGVIEKQRGEIQKTVEVRRAISTELRKFLNGETPERVKVIELGRQYGRLDGEMSWMYATAFAGVNRTLSADQRQAMMKLRNLEGYRSAAAYVYSDPMQSLPALPATDSFFAEPVRKQ